MNDRFVIDRNGNVTEVDNYGNTIKIDKNGNAAKYDKNGNMIAIPKPTSFRPGTTQGGNEAYKRRIDYDPENVRNRYIKFEEEYRRKELEAQKAVDDYKADISRKQEKLQSSVNSLKINLKNIDSAIKKSEETFAAATVAGNIEDAQEEQSRLESLQKGKEKTLRELSAFTNALDHVDGDERLYKRVLAKYEACVQMKDEFHKKSKDLNRVADEQIAIWESFSYNVSRGHIVLGVHVGGYNEIVKNHGA